MGLAFSTCLLKERDLAMAIGDRKQSECEVKIHERIPKEVSLVPLRVDITNLPTTSVPPVSLHRPPHYSTATTGSSVSVVKGANTREQDVKGVPSVVVTDTCSLCFCKHDAAKLSTIHIAKSLVGICSSSYQSRYSSKMSSKVLASSRIFSLSLTSAISRTSRNPIPTLRAQSLSSRTCLYSTTSRTMAAQPTAASQVISETAKAEGGPQSGSASAQMQSQVGKQRNFEQAAQEVGQKMQADPGNVTSQDAAYLKSREARARGQAQPPSDSISADAQRLAAANEGETKLSANDGHADPATQSAVDRRENLQQAAEQVAPKMVRESQFHGL